MRLRLLLALLTAVLAVVLSCELPVLDEESYLHIAGQLDPVRPYDWWRPWPPWGATREADAFVFAHPPAFLVWVWAWLKGAGSDAAMLPAVKLAAALPWALLLGWSFARLAERHTRWPWLAAGIWLTAPITLLGLQRGLMPDLMVAALSTYAVVCWFEALSAETPRQSRNWMVGAGVSLGLACATKYPALLMVLVFLIHGRSQGIHARTMWFTAAVVWLGIEAWLAMAYGRIHLVEVLTRAGEIPRGDLPGRTLGVAARLSLGVPMVALLVRGWRWSLLPMFIGGGLLALVGAPQGTPTTQFIVVAFLSAAGVGTVGLAVGVLSSRVRDALPGQHDPDLFFGLWLILTVVGVVFGHNFAAPRYLLTAIVPAALLFTRLLADRRDARGLLIFGAAVHGALGLGLTMAEHTHARAGVAVAEAAIQAHSEPGWFTGEWSFRWRMEQAGWQLLATGAKPTTGSVLVVGSDSAPGLVPPGATRGATWGSAAAFPLRVVDAGAGVGLYGETLGLLPFGWSHGATQEAEAWVLP